MIFEYSIILFLSQLTFTFLRTWNISAIAVKNIPQTLLSGAFIYMNWLVGIYIGLESAKVIMDQWKLEYLIVIASALIGGALGSYLVLNKAVLKKIIHNIIIDWKIWRLQNQIDRIDIDLPWLIGQERQDSIKLQQECNEAIEKLKAEKR